MANLSLELMNIGKFNLDEILVTVSVADANYTDSKTVSLGVNANVTLLNFAIPIPQTITAGQHHIDVTVALSSGASFRKSGMFTVPDSALAIEFSGTDPTLRAGDTVNLTIENTGGIDTSFTVENLSIIDAKGIIIYQGSGTGTILSGEKKSFSDIQIPFQTATGITLLNVRMKDNNTKQMAYYYKPIEIIGLDSHFANKD